MRWVNEIIVLAVHLDVKKKLLYTHYTHLFSLTWHNKVVPIQYTEMFV